MLLSNTSRSGIYRQYDPIFKVFVSISIAFIFLYCIEKMSMRSLWVDENTAMANYPLQALYDIFRPLPYYSQAAPPLFNVIMTPLSVLPFEIVRTALALIVFVPSVIVIHLAFRRFLTSTVAIGAMLSSSHLMLMATEMKYYSLEIPGVLLAICWTINRNPGKKIGWDDFFALSAAAVCGISTIVISFICLVAIATGRLVIDSRITVKDLFLFFSISVILIVYYLLIRYSTSIQITSYPDAYNKVGLPMLKSLWKNTIDVITPTGLVIAFISGLFGLYNATTRRLTARLAVILTAVFVSFSILSFVGKYPAVSPRHVTWTIAPYVLVVAVAANGIDAHRHLSQTFAALLISGNAFMIGSTMIYASGEQYEYTDNHSIIQWINEHPDVSIGLWVGAQALVETTGAHGILTPRKGPFFGQVNTQSAALDSAYLLDSKEIQANYGPISDNVEAHRHETGAYGRQIVYRTSKNYDAPANTLVSAAPRHDDFFIVASHLAWQDKDPLGAARFDGLIGALEKQRCSYAPVLIVKNAFVIKAKCSAAS